MMIANSLKFQTRVKFESRDDLEAFARCIAMARDTYFAGTPSWLRFEALRIYVLGLNHKTPHNLRDFGAEGIYTELADVFNRLANWHTTGARLKERLFDVALDLKNFSENPEPAVFRSHNLRF